MAWELLQQLGVSLGLGLLVGLQREWSAHMAGIRTFGLITVFGTVCGLLADPVGGWVVAAGLVAIGAILSLAHVTKTKESPEDMGLTTQAAALLMFGVGAAIVLVQMAVAIVIGGAVAVLLHWKKPLHEFVHRISEADIRAIIQLVLIALVILPVLPDKVYGPYEVLNPYQIWLMVVLICGISLGGYIAYKFLGARAGTLLGGLFGGVISSTATTVSYARRTRHTPDSAPLAAVVVMIASTIVFGRVAIEVAIVAPSILKDVIAPLAVMTGWMALISAAVFLTSRREQEKLPLDDDPSELKAAIVFGVLYALVLFGVAAAKEHFGDRGLYIVAALSGLTDMDAITLSAAKFIESQRVTADTGWRMILIGAMSNLLFKTGAIAVLGHRRLLKRMALLFGLSFAGGVMVLLLWP